MNRSTARDGIPAGDPVGSLSGDKQRIGNETPGFCTSSPGWCRSILRDRWSSITETVLIQAGLPLRIHSFDHDRHGNTERKQRKKQDDRGADAHQKETG